MREKKVMPSPMQERKKCLYGREGAILAGEEGYAFADAGAEEVPVTGGKGRILTEKGRFRMNMIVAVDRNWAIGLHNQLLVRIPNDQKHFRMETTGKVVVLGRKTLETFPHGLPLKNRTNIILSRDPRYHVKDAEVVHSIPELLGELEKYRGEDIFVIGGESIYRQMLPYCNVAHITKIDCEYQADAYFPNLDKDGAWHVIAESDEETYFDISYHFVKYERV